jgi:hypothetical protein
MKTFIICILYQADLSAMRTRLVGKHEGTRSLEGLAADGIIIIK